MHFKANTCLIALRLPIFNKFKLHCFANEKFQVAVKDFTLIWPMLKLDRQRLPKYKKTVSANVGEVFHVISQTPPYQQLVLATALAYQPLR